MIEGGRVWTSGATNDETPVGRVDFVDSDFNRVINDKGSEVTYESAYKCPCIIKSGAGMTSCMNCGGSGWVFVNPINTKMLISSLQGKNKRSDWSVEDAGTMNVTPLQGVILSYMDRITVTNSDSIHSQILYPVMHRGKLMSFLKYHPYEVQALGMFVSPDKKILWLANSEYNISDAVISIDSKYYKENARFTIRYIHPVQYHVIDIPKETRRSNTIHSGIDASRQIAQSVIARKAHYVMDPIDFNGDGLHDNSFQR